MLIPPTRALYTAGDIVDYLCSFDALVAIGPRAARPRRAGACCGALGCPDVCRASIRGNASSPRCKPWHVARAPGRQDHACARRRPCRLSATGGDASNATQTGKAAGLRFAMWIGHRARLVQRHRRPSDTTSGRPSGSSLGSRMPWELSKLPWAIPAPEAIVSCRFEVGLPGPSLGMARSYPAKTKGLPAIPHGAHEG